MLNFLRVRKLTQANIPTINNFCQYFKFKETSIFKKTISLVLGLLNIISTVGYCRNSCVVKKAHIK